MTYKSWVNTIPVKDKMIMYSFWITCGHWPGNIICGKYCPDAVYTNMYLLGWRYCNLFQKSFKRYLYQPYYGIKKLCSMEQKDSGTSKIKTIISLLSS